jgi:hypothetical protein
MTSPLQVAGDVIEFALAGAIGIAEISPNRKTSLADMPVLHIKLRLPIAYQKFEKEKLPMGCLAAGYAHNFPDI